MKARHLFISLALGLTLTLALLWTMEYSTAPAQAASHSGPLQTLRAPRAELHVCLVGPPTCDYDSIQDAVDAADTGDLIKVAAGVYTDTHERPVPVGYPSPPDNGLVTQIVYISKSVTIRGGYTTTNDLADPPDPVTNPTTLDAQGSGRVRGILVAAPAPGTGISPTIEGLQVTSGNAYGLGGGIAGSAGGGVYIINATATLSNCWLFGNDAYYGGGLYLYDSFATLSGSDLYFNSALYGGGLHLESSDVTLKNSNITSNTAGLGGGMNLVNSTATLKDNFINANTAGVGGGLSIRYSDAILNSNTICSNTANSDGGGLQLWYSIARLDRNRINSNHAPYGGGLQLYNSPATMLNGNDIFSNTANYGGGLRLYGSAAKLNGNAISSNTAYTNGGGLYLTQSAAMFSGNTILSNTAIYSGGGLYLQYSDATLINNVVADNQAHSAGSGLYIRGSSPLLLHTTIARNTGGDGSGLHVVNNSTVELTNTILVSHSIGITVAAGNKAKLEATMWGTATWANLTDWGGAGTIITGSPNVWGDPDFVNPDAGDYHIGSASAARDVVSFTLEYPGVKRDIDSQIRPMDWGYDLGADEFSGVGLDITKEPSAVSANPGQTLTYTIFVTSAGSESATGVVLTDTLDAWQRPVNATSSVDGCSIADGSWGGAVVCSLGTLVPSATARVTLTAQVSDGVMLRQEMVNTVIVTANETVNGIQVSTYGQNCHARINDDPTEYTHVQTAVDDASPGDLVRVAGVCVGASERGGLRQQVYLSKSLTIQGGYTVTNDFAGPPDPLTNPTTLDALGQGRVLYIAGIITPTIKGLRITGGDASGLGGGVERRDAGGGMYVVAATAIISDNQVFDNVAIAGGGLYLQSSAETQLIDNLIDNNSTFLNGQGAGLYFENSADVMLTGNTISNNEPAPWRRGWGSGGGAVFDASPGATLNDNTINNNRASWSGGLVFRNSPTATLVANTISDNVGDHSGGGMKGNAGVNFDHSDNATLISNTISGNRAANSCGGVCFETSHNAVLIANVIISNTRGGWWDGFGVGVYLNNSQNTSLVGNTISHNTAYNINSPGTIVGGGLYINNSTAELKSNTISSNDATRGGGLYVGNSTVALISNTITSNAVYSSCGAWCYDSVGCGGGIHLSNSSAVLTNTVIADNQAETVGAGLYVAGSAITLTNSIVVDNQITSTDQITGNGSGLYVAGSSVWLLHPTIARNSGGDGSGLYITGTANAFSTVFMTNTILVSHSVGITVAAGNTATLEATLWGTATWANLVDWGGDGTVITNAPNLWDYPAFVNPDSGDYHIGPGSAAIDAVVNAGVMYDIDGELRPMGRDYDIGADELLIMLAVSKQADPNPVQTGAQLTFTLRVTNTGKLDLHATITDFLPAHVAPGGVLTWTPTITTPGGVWLQTVVVTVERGYVGLLTNLVEATTAEGVSGSGDCIVTVTDEPITGLVALNDSPTPLSQTTTLTASISAGSNVVYAWDLGDGQEYVNGAVVTHHYSPTGFYTASVTASNSVSIITATTTITVDEIIKGLVAFNGSPTPLSQTTTLTANVDTGSNVVYTWAFGDGNFGDGEVTTNTYPYTGTYTAIVTASNSVSALTATTTVTITDLPSLSINDVRVTEGDSGPTNAILSVTLSFASSQPITVQYATGDVSATAQSGDYTTTSDLLNFLPGVTTLPITVSVQGDAVDEADELFAVNLFNPVNAVLGDAQGYITILDDDYSIYLPLVLRNYP